MWDTVPGHDLVEVLQGKNLSIIVLGLKVATIDGHDALVGSVVYVASHGGPLGDVFDMVRRDPSMLEISTRLYAINKSTPSPGPT